MSQNEVRIELSQQGYDEQIGRINRLEMLMKDTTPIWREWAEKAHKFWMENWGFQGRPYGLRWQGLSEKYKKRKRREIGSAKADLIYSGRLKDAVNGGAGWTERVDGSNFEFGIGIEYASIHQFGGPIRGGIMPQRPYIVPADNRSLPAALVTELELIIDKQMRSA